MAVNEVSYVVLDQDCQTTGHPYVSRKLALNKAGKLIAETGRKFYIARIVMKLEYVARPIQITDFEGGSRPPCF